MTDAATPRRAPDPRKAVWIRLVVAPVLLAVVVGVLVLHDRTGSFLPTDIVLALVAAGAAVELARLLREGGHRPHAALGALAAGAIAGVGLLAPNDVALRWELRSVLVAALVLALLLRHLRDVSPGAVSQIATSLVPPLYAGFLLSWLREAAVGPYPARTLLWVVVTAKASDIGGWVIGKPFGRHKLIPSVSPGKSWEGLAGGLAFSVVAALLLPPLLGLPEDGGSVARRIAFGLALGLAATLAGVTQSGWKRRVGAKDSSPLIPEVGGLLDLVDSLLIAGPVAWLWFRLSL